MGDLNKIWAMEETKARQRSRDRNVVEGDRNTKYFQTVANQRRKTLIHAMEGPDGLVHDTKDIVEIASNFYKDLFKSEDRTNISLTDNFFAVSDKAKDCENEILEAPFTDMEIKKVVFEAYSDGAPRPDGLSFIFYQHFWDLIKSDLCTMFQAFHRGELDHYRLNFSLITLIPKEKDACTMSKFRPISLLNCSYKIFTKVLTNRMNLVVDRLICSNQTAFI